MLYFFKLLLNVTKQYLKQQRIQKKYLKTKTKMYRHKYYKNTKYLILNKLL